MEVFKCIHSRRSVRDFLPKQIPGNDLLKILEAASAAPSGLNLQPWHFVIVKNPQTIAKMKRIILDAPSPNQRRFLFKQKYKSLYNAPCVIAACLDTEKRWYHDAPKTAEGFFDNPDSFSLAAAVQNLMLAAHALGLGTCWVSLYSSYRKDLEKLLGIDPPFRLVANILIGYAKTKPPVPSRKPLKKIHRIIR